LEKISRIEKGVWFEMRAKRGESSEILIEEVKKIISEFNTKLTLRQIYYQLVSKHLIQNVKSQYQRLSKILVKARHDGTIDWEDIEDRTRSASGGDEEEDSAQEHFDQAVNYMKNSWEYYNLPTWLNQPIYLEVWFEKQALEGIFKQITKKYNVTQLACKGYSSHTMGYELKKRIDALKTIGEDMSAKELHIVYFGDHDPSGIDIYRFVQVMCERFGLDVNFERIAITKEQIEKYNIPPMFAKSSDSRYEKFVADYGMDVVELDALRPDVLQKLIEDEIRKRFDWEIYEQTKAEQEKRRKQIKRMINKFLKQGAGEK
jgi:hypothetical protein